MAPKRAMIEMTGSLFDEKPVVEQPEEPTMTAKMFPLSVTPWFAHRVFWRATDRLYRESAKVELRLRACRGRIERMELQAKIVEIEHIIRRLSNAWNDRMIATMNILTVRAAEAFEVDPEGFNEQLGEVVTERGRYWEVVYNMSFTQIVDWMIEGMRRETETAGGV